MRRALRTIKHSLAFLSCLKSFRDSIARTQLLPCAVMANSPPTAGCCADIGTDLPYRMAMVHRADCAHLKSCPPD